MHASDTRCHPLGLHSLFYIKSFALVLSFFKKEFFQEDCRAYDVQWWVGLKSSNIFFLSLKNLHKLVQTNSMHK